MVLPGALICHRIVLALFVGYEMRGKFLMCSFGVRCFDRAPAREAL